MADAGFEKKIKVLIAGSKRVQKEYFYYQAELIHLQGQLIVMQHNQSDKIHKQEELVAETRSMFKNVIARLEEIISEQHLYLDKIDEGPLKNELIENIEAMNQFLDQVSAANP